MGFRRVHHGATTIGKNLGFALRLIIFPFFPLIALLREF